MNSLNKDEIKKFTNLYNKYLKINSKIKKIENDIDDTWNKYHQLSDVESDDNLEIKIANLENEASELQNELEKIRKEEDEYMNFLQNKYNKEFIIKELKRIFLNNENKES